MGYLLYHQVCVDRIVDYLESGQNRADGATSSSGAGAGAEEKSLPEGGNFDITILYRPCLYLADIGGAFIHSILCIEHYQTIN